MMNWNEFQKWTAAFCAWREARGEVALAGRDALRGVLHVIDNRAKKRNKTWAEIVWQYEQFSSITAPHDPQIVAGLVPTIPDPIFTTCYEIADIIFNGGDFDLTSGATHYFADSIPPPTWAAAMIPTIKLGHHQFYKEQ